MSALCEDTGLSVTGCGHCRGVRDVDLDTARMPDAPAPDPTPAPVPPKAAPYRPGGKRTHTQRLLDTLPAVYAQLGDALHGTRSGGEGERVTGGGDTRPAPLQMQVAELRHQVLHDLRWWVGNHGQPLSQQVGDSVAHMCAVLLYVLPDLEPDDMEALHGTLRDLHRQARVLTDLPKLRGRIPLGACPNSEPATMGKDLAEWERELLAGVGWTCEGTLWACLPADKGAPVYLTCQDCGGRWDVRDLPEAANVQLAVHEAATLLGVTERTIQRRTGNRTAGLVRLGDALKVDA